MQKSLPRLIEKCNFQIAMYLQWGQSLIFCAEWKVFIDLMPFSQDQKNISLRSYIPGVWKISFVKGRSKIYFMEGWQGYEKRDICSAKVASSEVA